MYLKDLRQVSVVGMGLLGASITLGVSRGISFLRSVGYSHRKETREKARLAGVVDRVEDSLADCVKDADIVILASPIFTFENLFREISEHLKPGCIVTDVGSTKTMPHKWAAEILRDDVHYVGSHPIAGSEKSGLEYGRDDLFVGSNCIITTDAGTDPAAAEVLKDFWSRLGCFVKMMTPAGHDGVFGRVSHLPHMTAVALMNASDEAELPFAGRGFIDTSRVASGPESVWVDILMTNRSNSVEALRKMRGELERLENAIAADDSDALWQLLKEAREKRERMIENKLSSGELI